MAQQELLEAQQRRLEMLKRSPTKYTTDMQHGYRRPDSQPAGAGALELLAALQQHTVTHLRLQARKPHAQGSHLPADHGSKRRGKEVLSAIAHAADEIKARDQTIVGLTQKLSILQTSFHTERDSWQKEEVKSKAELAKTTVELQASQRDMQGHKKLVAALTNENKTLAAKLHSLEGERDVMEAAYLQAEALNYDDAFLRRQISSLTEANEAITKRSAQLGSEVASKAAELSKRQQERSVLEASYREMEIALKESISELAVSEGETERLQRGIEGVEEEKVKLKEELNALAAEVTCNYDVGVGGCGWVCSCSLVWFISVFACLCLCTVAGCGGDILFAYT